MMSSHVLLYGVHDVIPCALYGGHAVETSAGFESSSEQFILRFERQTVCIKWQTEQTVLRK